MAGLMERTDGKPDFGVVYEKTYPRLVAYFSSRTGNLFDAQDLAQTALVKAWGAWNKYQAVGPPVEAWIFVIARNTYLNAVRSRGRRVSVPVENMEKFGGGFDPTGDEVLERERWAQLAEAWRYMANQHPKYCQRLDELLSDEPPSYQELAEKEGTTIQTIKSQVWRARRFLENRVAAVNGRGTTE